MSRRAVDRPNDTSLITTGEAAKLLGSSRQHVVDLCEAGDLPYITTGKHRRIRRDDIETLRSRTDQLTGDQRRSLWLGYAHAGKVVMDPTAAVVKARANLERLTENHTRGQAARRLAEWDRILNGPIDGVLDALASRSPRARELRQNSPFAGLLADGERRTILQGFRREEIRIPRPHDGPSTKGGEQ